MAKVILQPAGGPDAKRHFKDTSAKNVPMAVIARYVQPQDLKELEKTMARTAAQPGEF